MYYICQYRSRCGRPLRRSATCSYALYHLPVLAAVARLAPAAGLDRQWPPTTIARAVAACLAAAAIGHLVIERPAV
jgi:peptidoglycan/LPS O-acetylase OafA/YrhL